MLDYNRLIATWNEFIQEYPDAIDIAEFDILKEDAYIKKVGSKWCIFSEDGRNLGCKGSKKEAEDRLAEIEMFKHMKSGQEESVKKSRRKFCICDNCGVEFTTTKECDLTKCPSCGEYKGVDVEDEEMTQNSEKTIAKQECYCPDCGREFFVSTMCHLERCRYCGGDDLEEITGEL
jgi:hypothetical protein